MIKALVVLASITCNQAIFDQFYEQVHMYNAGLAAEKLYRMNEYFQQGITYVEPTKANFELIRRLCNGQKSTYEGEKNGK